MAIDYPGKSIVEQVLQQKMQQMYSQQATTASRVPETIEWAKFSMWLRGFLGALEGKQLTAEDTSKIMEKLATVDPESQNWRFDIQKNAAPPNPWLGPGHPVQPYQPHWTYQGTTTNAEDLEQLKSYLTALDTVVATGGTGSK